MQLKLAFFALSATLSAQVADAGRCKELFAVIDPNGNPHCCQGGYWHNGVDCVPCSDPSQYYDRNDQMCKDPRQCDKPGYVFFWSLGRCEPKERCQPWGYFNGRDCEARPECPLGTHWELTSCVPDPCEFGQIFLGGRCQEKAYCDPDDNEYYDRYTNTCIRCSANEYPGLTGCRPRPVCANPEEFYQGPEKGCAPCQTPGTWWNGRECVPELTCPPGEHREGNRCVKNDCKLGQYWDIPKKSCQPIKHCEYGYIFDGVGDCMPIHYPPEGGYICYTKCDRPGPLYTI